MKVRLAAKEREYLLNCLNVPTAAVGAIRWAQPTSNGWIVDLPDLDADSIRDLCGERLQKVGFDENYELTEEGKILERLIDKFYTKKDRRLSP